MKLKKGIILAFAILSSVVLQTRPVFANDTVTICHTQSNPPQTLTVAGPAVQAHLDHGDYLGACNPAPVVPEFGLITGALAIVGSAGSFLVLKRKKIIS